MKRLVFTLISTLFFCLLLMAEDGTNKHVTKWLQLDQGLSNNFIVSLDIDRYGVLWIGTEEGMNRFDGVSVSSFTKYSGVLPGNELNRVVSLQNSTTDAVLTPGFSAICRKSFCKISCPLPSSA